MVELPERLRCVYTARLDQREESSVFEVPRAELEQGDVERGETYRVAVLAPTRAASSGAGDDDHHHDSDPSADGERTPPVEDGDVREVTIETLGDQGDGIAKIDRGYVVIVPGTRPDDEVTVEIVEARENVAFAQVHDDEDASLENASNPDEPVPGDTLGAE